LRMGDPWKLSTDVGPVIDARAQADIAEYIEAARTDGRLMHALDLPDTGHFIAPTLLRVSGIADMPREIFGPVLHLATFRSDQLDKVIDAINATGYGLTFGLQTRIDDRVQHVSERIHAGNIYVNRNQIGAIVGSQPFGGEGMSGTGPKAGGPHYLVRFSLHPAPLAGGAWETEMTTAALGQCIAAASPGGAAKTISLPGPTGESNRLTTLPRPPVLCLGPGPEAAQAQARMIATLGGSAVAATGAVSAEALIHLPRLGGVIWWGDAAAARALALALAKRDGPIVALITGAPDVAHARAERHVCVDTTAAGGNAALLSGAA